MTIDFAQVVSSPPSGRTTALIIDHAAYAQPVLLRGAPVPWLDETAFVNLLAQAEGLLKPDATLLDTAPVLDALLAQDSGLVAAMGARSRVGYALKTLLAHDGTAERVMRLVSVVMGTSGPASFLAVLKLAVCVVVGSAIVTLLIHGLLVVRLLAWLPPLPFFRGIADAIMVGFSTSSSSASVSARGTG